MFEFEAGEAYNEVMENKPHYKLSVRELVEAALPQGDLVLTPSSGRRLQEGTRLHQQYQQHVETPGYQAEVPLCYTLDTPHLALDISGRIDGLIEDGLSVCLEELKTTAADLDNLTPNPHYWAQIMCYGAMWCLTHDTERVLLRLVYIQLHTGETRALERAYEGPDIIREFLQLCQGLVARLSAHQSRVEARNQALTPLQFPFQGFRLGQRAMSAAIYRGIRDSACVMVEAPTGIGKTIAALFPAVKALGEGHGERIFYLAARGTLKQVAEQTVQCLSRSGAPLLSVTLTAKEKCCPTPGVGCHPGACPLAAGYYDRLPAALEEASAPGIWDAQQLALLAERHRLCPFELALDLSLEADIIICDFNYAFDPRVKLRRFFEEGGDHVLLVDECHNLVDRARDMFSSQLSWDDVMILKRALPGGTSGPLGRLKKAVGELQKAFVQLRHFLAQAGGSLQSEEPPEILSKAVRSFVRVAQDWMDAGGREPFMDTLADLFFLCRNYQASEEGYDGCCTVLMEAKEPHVRVRIFCMDPASRLAACYEKARACLFFSATLSPIEYFQRMLGLSGAKVLRLPSPFPRENLMILTADHLPTAYRFREASLAGVCRCLKAMVEAKEGCYFAFFPSYQYMQLAHQLFGCLCPDIDAPIQRAGMDEEARQAFLERFTADSGRSMLAFAVMGGLFSEGIDLVGDRLSGAAIVGVGLPQLDMERNVLRAYHDALGEDGFAYAYAYPGFNRVMQAAGRVIRTENDRGVVLLIDPRFAQWRYQALYPDHWLPLPRCSDERAVSRLLARFWAPQS